MSIFEQIEVEDKVMKMCRSLHEKLCEEAQELDESIMTTEEVNQLEPIEALKHMTEAIKDLLSHQRNLKTFEQYTGFHNSEIVQTTLQKLEADVREHIKIENQLKLYCENIESCIEETEKNNRKIEMSSKKKIEEIEKEREKLENEYQNLQRELNRIKNSKKGENMNEKDTMKEPEAELQAENDQKNVVLSDKLIKIKRLKEIAKSKEFLCKELAIENKDIMDMIKRAEDEKNTIGYSSLEYYKMKYKEKAREFLILKNKFKKNSRENAKSHSPLIKPARNSSSPLSKKATLTNIKKKSPIRVQMKTTKSLYRTLQTTASKL